MTINIKMETALVKQGHYIVQVSGMDVATTAEENRMEVEVISDGGDTGPAPLQNNEVEVDMYQEVVHFDETSAVRLN